MNSTDWILIKPNDVYDYLAAPQVELLRQRALTEGQSDPLIEIILDIVMFVRLHLPPMLQSSQKQALIPRELKGCACRLIVEALQSRIPNIRLTPDQVRNANNARKHLLDIAKGAIRFSSFPQAITAHRVSNALVTRQHLGGL
ncbi:MAG: hypothetical protein COZ46_07610 [Verrucomicrobia bacterium CG_4_10_14_3_um_filter_43_23]|nr:MAG: hypothetical protein AUJ82_03255 [Verrucomicrobia bacterium CG1_02_43_26]PIP59713.1 MAG: hypothetical protein COX01_02085 [Verrucomicrobia bacterium CG22_combo_CG10-13_8_21_14_all_43_17]PIX57725.1 MAG: hypothetical protein COZ46_07610 [Verrucomicrobia bacterium CG_4_10_14_3_um_filter_43_23]PIY62517.1 MAG: hypothetical protein COY94_01795 [Verrucomicrobia bacterium CG_4_10_14_0_8_um_filter_43_34]PJA44663.1 MAG: hypothetical protein CO175_01830 [Verrucomicrobia bacterium CG_4_9_14_3_um_fi